MSTDEYLIVGTNRPTWSTATGTGTAWDEATAKAIANKMRNSPERAEVAYLTGFAPPTLILPKPPTPRQCSTCVGRGRIRGRSCHVCKGKCYKGG